MKVVFMLGKYCLLPRMCYFVYSTQYRHTALIRYNIMVQSLTNNTEITLHLYTIYQRYLESSELWCWRMENISRTDRVGNERELHRVKRERNKKLNSVALVRERTIPTERPPPVGEVSANFADRGVSRGQHNGSPRPLISVFWTGAATFLFK